MFNVDWELFIRIFLPWYKRKPKFIAWLNALLQPLKELHSTFLTYVDDVLYRLSITSQIIYLEKLLNDKFNSGLPARAASGTLGLYDGVPTGIYITDPDSFVFPNYIWNRIEERPKTFIYNKWRDYVVYDTNEFAVVGTEVYQAIEPTLNNPPASSPAKWTFYKDVSPYFRNKEELNGQYEFVVHVPDTLTDVTTDLVFVAAMKAHINVYRIAGTRFQIVNYTP